MAAGICERVGCRVAAGGWAVGWLRAGKRLRTGGVLYIKLQKPYTRPGPNPGPTEICRFMYSPSRPQAPPGAHRLPHSCATTLSGPIAIQCAC